MRSSRWSLLLVWMSTESRTEPHKSCWAWPAAPFPMRTGVALLSSDVDVATAKQQFEKEKVHSWPIGDHNYLQGVVRSHDIETAQPSPAAARADPPSTK